MDAAAIHTLSVHRNSRLHQKEARSAWLWPLNPCGMIIEAVEGMICTFTCSQPAQQLRLEVSSFGLTLMDSSACRSCTWPTRVSFALAQERTQPASFGGGAGQASCCSSLAFLAVEQRPFEDPCRVRRTLDSGETVFLEGEMKSSPFGLAAECAVSPEPHFSSIELLHIRFTFLPTMTI